MYFFVPYQLTGIQQGIQAGHAALEYANKFYNSELFQDFVKNHKTWVILNGGTTNANYENRGTLNIIIDVLEANNVDISYFCEPDLQDAVTAVCFICDEQVFNRDLYPDFKDWMIKNRLDGLSRDSKYTFNLLKNNYTSLSEEYPVYHKTWLELIGGTKNAFLKELLNGKKLA